MQKDLIRAFFKNTSLEGKSLVESLCQEIQVLVVKYKNNRMLIQTEMLEKYDYLDEGLFDLLYGVATLYLN